VGEVLRGRRLKKDEIFSFVVIMCDYCEGVEGTACVILGLPFLKSPWVLLGRGGKGLRRGAKRRTEDY